MTGASVALASLHTEAEVVKHYDPDLARTIESCARRVEEAIEAHQAEPLTVAEAATESGYSESQIRRMIAEGVLPNAGTDTERRVLRKHLPRKPGHGIIARPRLSPAPSTRQEIARAMLERRR